jgi:riboflavin synthase
MFDGVIKFICNITRIPITSPPITDHCQLTTCIMFTGIIETLGEIVSIEKKGGNLTFSIRSSISSELKIDQSVSHNGACLTVVEVADGVHKVTAIHETLEKTNLGSLKTGDRMNLERCLKLSDRLDGHMVQGHVDQAGRCTGRIEDNGSWLFTFEYDASAKNITVEKGSICVNGVSLTVVNSARNSFRVAIIPYTFQNTTFKTLQPGDTVNLEFDILGKYITRWLELKE